MVFILTLPAAELEDNLRKFYREERLTKAFPKNTKLAGRSNASIVLVLRDTNGARNERTLAWIGVRSRIGTLGAVDSSITVDPLRPSPVDVPIDGSDGLLAGLPEALQQEFANSTAAGPLGVCGQEAWEVINATLRRWDHALDGTLDWLLAQANRPVFDPASARDRTWQEERDGSKWITRCSGFPANALAGWNPPADPDATYLAGVVPKPAAPVLAGLDQIEYEPDLKRQDLDNLDLAFGMFRDRRQGRGSIQVLTDRNGRRLEILDLNDGPVEGRTGTDIIYYHEPTKSMVFVQYKRLDQDTKSLYVNKRFRDQLNRMDEVALLNKDTTHSSDWRLGGDSFFFKLAHWPDTESENSNTELTPGMYMPTSYVRLLLADNATLGKGASGTARYLGYDTVERYLVNDQFVELVKHGLVGTVGVTVDEVNKVINDELDAGKSVMVGTERSPETPRQRQNRTRTRGARDRRYTHDVIL